MTTFTVNTNCGTSKDFETRREAERGAGTHVELCEECGESDVSIETSRARATDGSGASADATDDGESSTGDGLPAAEPLPPDLHESMRTDPLDVVPDYMIDMVEGQPAINKRGYAVIASHFDIVVQAEPITTAGETDHEYAEFSARAWKKEDGPENAYTGHATARASEDRRGVADNLNEMAETRAMKRAVAWASGVGILAWEELAGTLDEHAVAP